MKLKSKIAGLAVAAMLTTGASFAQNAGGEHQRRGNGAPGQSGAMGRGHNVERLATVLDLTDAQKTQAQTIFETARTSAKPVGDQLKQGRQELMDAAKANRPGSEIDSLAARQGTLMGQLSGIQAKAFASFYAILTPEQKAKAEKLHDLFRPAMGRSFKRGNHQRPAVQ